MVLSSGALFLLTGAVLVAAVSWLALYNFAQKEVGWLSFLTSLLGFVLSFGIVALVPYDVYEALSAEDQNADSTRSQVLVSSSWELIYWATFLLCWILCPVLIEYEAAGDFTVWGRLRASVNRNAAWCAGYLISGVCLFVWLTLAGGVGLRAWCIAASNAWGLLLSTILMGYGLVAVPRHLWRLASPKAQLQTLYCVAVSMDEARLSTQFELQDVIGEARVEMIARTTQPWDGKLERAFNILQATLEECEQLHCELTNGARGPAPRSNGGIHRSPVPGDLERGEHRTSPTQTSEDLARLESMGELHRALKQVGLEARRASCRWQQLVGRCMQLEDLEEQMFPSAVELATSSQGPISRLLFRSHFARSLWHRAVLLWMSSLRAKMLRMASGFCTMLSCVIVLGQLTMFSESWSLSMLSVLFQTSHGFWMTQVFCALPLGYMVCTAYWSIFRLKIAGFYGLYSDNNTDTSSLLWCASTLARLAAPLCYHFLFLTGVKGTAFQEMMGQMNVVPVLGGSLNEVFPVLVAFLVLCNLLNIYSRLVQFCGFDALEVEWNPQSPSNDATDLLSEGRRLVERERRKRSDEKCLLDPNDRIERRDTVPLRFQIAALIEEGTLPLDWNAASGP